MLGGIELILTSKIFVFLSQILASLFKLLGCLSEGGLVDSLVRRIRDVLNRAKFWKN